MATKRMVAAGYLIPRTLLIHIEPWSTFLLLSKAHLSKLSYDFSEGNEVFPDSSFGEIFVVLVNLSTATRRCFLETPTGRSIAQMKAQEPFQPGFAGGQMMPYEPP